MSDIDAQKLNGQCSHGVPGGIGCSRCDPTIPESSPNFVQRCPMKISELVQALQLMKEQYGDLYVITGSYMQDVTSVTYEKYKVVIE